MMFRGKRARLGFDAEELRDEILYVRRGRDQEIRLFLRRRRLRAGRDQALAQGSVALAEKVQKGRVDARESFALVQIVEADPEAEVHGG
jgi:hypothetical protein